MYTVPKNVGRFFRGVMYLCFAGAGFFFWFRNSGLLEGIGADYTAYVWAAFLFFGGVAGLFSTITDIWLGEYAGLLLLATVFLVYGVAGFIRAGWHVEDWAFPFVCFAWMAGLLARWRYVHVVQRTARKAQNNGGS
jgi:hypothetical protein